MSSEVIIENLSSAHKQLLDDLSPSSAESLLNWLENLEHYAMVARHGDFQRPIQKMIADLSE